MKKPIETIKIYQYFTLLLVLIFFLIKSYLILNNSIDTERGDASAYFYYGILGLEKFNDIKEWLNIHPPLSSISSAAVYNIYEIFRFGGIISYVKFALLVNTTIYLSSSWIVYLLVKKLFNINIGLITVLLFSSAGLIQIYTLNGSAENYALIYFLLSLYFFIDYFDNKKIIYIIFSSFMLLLASMCRTEVLIIVPVVIIFIWLRGSLFHSILFGVIAGLFEVFKVTMKYLIYDGSIVGYENMGKIWGVNSKSIGELLFNNDTLDYFLYSFNPYFSVAIFIYALFLISKKEYKVFIYLFIFMALILTYFQYSGRIVTNARYAFFPIILFVFVIASVFHHLFTKYKINIKNYRYIFLFIVVLSVVNFYKAVEEKTTRVPKSIVNSRVWLENNLEKDDYILLDYVNYWSLNFRLYLQAKFSENGHHTPHWYYYAIGNSYITKKQNYGIARDKDLYKYFDNDRIDKILESPYIKTTSPDFRLKQKIVAELFIKDKKPKYFLIPKKVFQRHDKYSYIRDKMVPMNGKFFVKLKFLDFKFILSKKFENGGFTVYEANYEKS